MYNKNGPVITITPRTVTGMVENLGSIIDKIEAFVCSSKLALFMLGDITKARYIRPPIQSEAPKLWIKSMIMDVMAFPDMAAP
jgi:hypothetical protein